MIGAPRSENAMSDMAAVMARVRKMSDAQLADILSGKDVSVPQFAAMTEAMGRRQLRDAVKGAQAQQQAQQPSVKDQLLAEEAGLAALPAPNMESIDMAGGGIIAFDRGGDVESSLTEEERQQLKDRRDLLLGGKKLLASAADVVTLPVRAGMGALNTGVIRPVRALGIDLPYIPEEAFGGSSSSMTPYFDRYVRKPQQADANAAEVAKVLSTPIGDQAGDYPMPADVKAAKVAKDASTGAGASSSGIAALQASKFDRRASPFADMRAEQQDYEKLKSQGLGEGLMKMGAGLLSAPGTKGFAAGIQALAESGALSRKEIAGLKKDARDYDLNVKRAEEAFNQGQDELGFKYMQEANTNRYRMAALAQEPGELRTLRAIAQDPKLAGFYKGNKGAMSIMDATKEFNDLAEKNPRLYRELVAQGIKTPRDYLSYATTGLPPGAVVDTLQEGAKVRQ